MISEFNGIELLGEYYDLHDATYGVSSTPDSLLVVFNTKEDATNVNNWLKTVINEYIDDLRLLPMDADIYESTGMDNVTQTFYLVSNQTD